MFGLLMVLSMLSPPTCMSFCFQPSPPKVCTEFFASDAVFVGVVVSTRYIPGGTNGSEPGWSYRLKVLKMFRGPKRSSIDVFTENASERFQLEDKHKYILFANESAGVLQIDDCGNSAPLERSGDTIEAITRVLDGEASKAGGRIIGRIERAYGYEERKSLEGISILAISGQKTYSSVTKADGSFEMHVQAGNYVVRTGRSTMMISPYDLSFTRPDDVVIHNGGCGEIIFRAFPE